MSKSPLFTLRQYTPADHDEVMEVHRLGLRAMGRDDQHRPLDSDLEHIEDFYLRRGDFLVGECDGQIVAIGGLRVSRPSVGELRRMRIHADHYGRAYDQALLDALTERAAMLGVRYLSLDVDERRVPAQELYQRNGFVPRGTLLVSGTPSIVFEKRLGTKPGGGLPALLEETIAQAEIAGIAVAWNRRGSAPAPAVVGHDAQGRPLSEDSLYPTASLTKLAVALGVLRLVDRGTLDLDAPITRVLPEATNGAGVTLRGLLSHTAGMPELPLVVEGEWADIGGSCLTTPAESAPGARVSYSNLGYGTLGLALERATGQSFGAALRGLVFEPLGLEAYLREELPREPVQGWRFRVLPAGGVFMTVRSALGIVDALHRPPAGFLSRETLEDALRDQTGGVTGGMGPRLQWTSCPWGLGPEIRGNRYSPWIPNGAGARSFGHAGASGCVAWADPDTDTTWAILTVPPTDRATGVRWQLQSRPNLADVGEAVMRDA